MIWYGVIPSVLIDSDQGVGAQHNAGRRRGGLTADRNVNEILRPVFFTIPGGSSWDYPAAG